MPENTDTAPNSRRGRRSGTTVVLWVCQVLVALLFVMAGAVKLAGAVEAVAMFEVIGAGQWFRYFTGVVELAGAVGLLIPRLAGLAAAGLICVMIGALIVQGLFIGGSPVLPIVLIVVNAWIAWMRWPEMKSLVGSSVR
ncbi:DoxX family protein [Parasphingorhabdus pacifica]